MKRNNVFHTLSLSVLLCAATAGALLLRAQDVAQRSKQLSDLIGEEWEFELRATPEAATIIGDNRYNDRLSDVSLESIQAFVAQSRKFLERLGSIDTTGFPEQERLNKVLLTWNLRVGTAFFRWRPGLEGFSLNSYETPVDQFDGIHLLLAELVAFTPFHTVQDYQNYVARLHQIPRVLDQAMDVCRIGVRDGRVPPRFLLEKVVGQADAAGISGTGSPFAGPLEKFPNEISATDRDRLRNAVLTAIENEVSPAYRRFARYVKEDYAPKGRGEPGIWMAPNGDALYRYNIKLWTTTDLPPETIHELGRKQVAAIEDEMTALGRKLGYSDLNSFRGAMRQDKQHLAMSREQILDSYRKYADQMYNRLPELFGRLPKAHMTVVPTESFREKEAAAAEYMIGSEDGSRPGRVQVNTGDFDKRTLMDIEATEYHEGVPGHHLQISLAQELPALPPFRRHSLYGAFTEGWGLYAERLGKEVGFYQDPYSDYGRLSMEMLRAIRLVVDTGVHAKHWTRQQMVDYFHAHSTVVEPEVQAEVDRYIAVPGQALAYKLGQLKILELRERARQQLGNRFDIREFHDELLGAGALPLDVLEQRMDAWIKAKKNASHG